VRSHVNERFRRAFDSLPEDIQRRARAAYALCRPPGHHAARSTYGGYCYLNNAALAAQSLLDGGCRRVSVVDVDYHHGNGTQEIFWERDDVQFVSLHGDPETEYPWFMGYADERGGGRGEGYTLNFPLPAGTVWDAYRDALVTALDAVTRYAPDAIVVSLGVDTFAADPISSFKLESRHYPMIGERLAALGAPADVVLSDAAPKLTGVRATDRARLEALLLGVEAALPKLLRPGGGLLLKILDGPEAERIERRVQAREQRRQHLLLVVHGNHDRDAGTHEPSSPSVRETASHTRSTSAFSIPGNSGSVAMPLPMRSAWGNCPSRQPSSRRCGKRWMHGR